MKWSKSQNVGEMAIDIDVIAGFKYFDAIPSQPVVYSAFNLLYQTNEVQERSVQYFLHLLQEAICCSAHSIGSAGREPEDILTSICEAVNCLFDMYRATDFITESDLYTFLLSQQPNESPTE